MGVVDRRRHQRRGLVAGIAEHDALVAGTLVLVAGGIDALGDMGRLGMEIDRDVGGLPVEAFLLVADILDRLAGELDHRVLGDGIGTAHLAGDDDAVGGGKRLAGHAGLGLCRQIGIDDGVGDPVADLVRMTLGNGFTGEKIAGAPHDGGSFRQ